MATDIFKEKLAETVGKETEQLFEIRDDFLLPLIDKLLIMAYIFMRYKQRDFFKRV